MKKILGLTIAVLLIIGTVGGGTWAYFSDTETSTGNTWTAGTLNLINVINGTATNSSISINGGAPGTDAADGINDQVSFGLTAPIEPGSSGTITWTLSNTGSVAGTLTMVATTTFGEGAAPNDAELTADPTNLVGLGQNLMVWVTLDGTEVFGTAAVPVPMSGLAAFLSAQSQSMVGTPPGTALVYVLNWLVPTSVGNEIQGDTATLNINFALTQN